MYCYTITLLLLYYYYSTTIILYSTDANIARPSHEAEVCEKDRGGAPTGWGVGWLKRLGVVPHLRVCGCV